MSVRQKITRTLLGCLGLWPLLGNADDDFAFFENKIRPILVDHCYSCHSAGAEKVKGSLLLDSKQGLLKGGESGPAILPGDPENSLLIKAVRYGDKDLQMPPKDKKLSDFQITDLTAWIKMGAPDPRTNQVAAAFATTNTSPYDFEAARKLWAFHPPADPDLPKTRNTKWAKNSIDHFILAKLEERGLRPAPSADKRTLIRRATFDLIGLPPTPEEVEAFLKDKSPDAFSRVVERLLASPHYGERWARHWLDVVRYTDSLDSRVVGTEQDSLDAWRYRDWAVQALNNDLPYDRFIIEQVAGDLLPPPEPDGLDTNAVIATGMYAIGNWGNGDADKDKILTDIADDAVDVTGRAFLGLTLACARCHDHKFDPIPTADYYSMAGIFFSSHILAKLTPKGAGETLMRIPLVSKAEMERRKQREVRIAELEKQIEKIQDEQVVALANNGRELTDRYLLAAWELRGSQDRLPSLAATNGLNPFVLRRWIDFFESGNLGLFSQPVRDLLGNRGLHAWRMASGADTPSVVANSTDQESTFLTIKLPPRRLAIHPSPKDGVAVAWKSPMNGAIRIKGRVVDVDPNCGDGVDWEIMKISGETRTSLSKSSIASGGMEQIAGKEPSLSCEVAAGEFVQVNVFPKGGYECDTTMIELEIAEASGQRTWNLNHDVVPDFLASNPHADSFGRADVWYFRDLAERSPTAPAGSGLAQWLDLRKEAVRPGLEKVKLVAAKIREDLSASEGKAKAYEGFVAPRGSFWAPLRNEEAIFSAEARATVQKFRAELAELRNRPVPPIAMAHGLQDGGVPESPHAGVHDVKIHVRGRYDRLGELAPRRFPRLLAGDEQKPITDGSGRLPLAKWIASPANPLTARVMVNRIWQHHFGEGIVRTPNNYGKLGTPPTHPDLLDHLAHRFIESGWSIKAMHRALMLSATYQQSSIPQPATLKADPENKFFGRMNRRRLDAESLRDSLLMVAGGLDRAFGGPAIRDLNNNRRTLYLMTIRSDRSNYRSLFDAADSNAIVEQRASSTVAPQALFLMNHPFVLAQARALSQRVTALDASNARERIEWLYRNLYGRLPAKEETVVGLAMLDASRQNIAQASDAWLEYCQVLLCANEFVYVD
jgi:hypothetical protein